MDDQRTVSRERAARTANGLLVLLVGIGLILLGPITVAQSPDAAVNIAGGLGLALLGLFLLCGLYALQPNEGVAILLFGDYRGTDRATGLRWVLPWYTRKKISLRARNVTSDKLKVNDRRGSPVEIAANVVWRVEDSARPCSTSTTIRPL